MYKGSCLDKTRDICSNNSVTWQGSVVTLCLHILSLSMSPALAVDKHEREAMLVQNSVANIGVQDNEKNLKQMGHQHVILLCSAAFMLM